MTAITAPFFHDDDKAREYLEKVRWPNGVTCPHCGHDEVYAIAGAGGKKGTMARPGLYKCAKNDCRKQFSVTVGTVFERSKIPLSKWLYAAYLLCSSKKGISSHQLHRTLGVTYKTAWFMTHRIRAAMDTGFNGQMGSGGGVVEADETYIGRKPGKHGHAGWGHKNMVFSLVERDGLVRSTHLSGDKFDQIKNALRQNVSPDAHLMTDQAKMYKKVGKEFRKHSVVNHSQHEYVRGQRHTNTIEGFFSVFKRGMKGVYQHCSSKHLDRYLSEFDFRYNHRIAMGTDDMDRTRNALKGIEGKRLTYRRAD